MDHATPSECQTLSDVLNLDRSVFESGDYWMLVNHDGSVAICQQENGQPVVEMVTVPRHVLHEFITWYETDQGKKK